MLSFKDYLKSKEKPAEHKPMEQQTIKLTPMQEVYYLYLQGKSAKKDIPK